MSASRRRLWLMRETDKARLFATANRAEDSNLMWIPKSIVEHISWEKEIPGQPREAEVTLPDWFIEKENL